MWSKPENSSDRLGETLLNKRLSKQIQHEARETHQGKGIFKLERLRFILIDRLAERALKLCGALQGYTSPGAGSSGVAARLNCPPEITMHVLRRATGQKKSAPAIGLGQIVETVLMCLSYPL